ncbi:cytochrome c oxidase assembly protein [Metabacillus fastidiosus]|uniref:cytochrome c oxidase assembly protein n=1 Tax=Metabacillus fastidiosus TaxID=1458 RepID=UPI002E1EC831|nr:cytochrome c oxidase assembly protein [Metabacillus fastidiosus]
MISSHESFNYIIPQVLLALPFFFGLIFYLLAAVISNRRYRKWPLFRIVYATLGILCAIISVAGPLADLAHTDFTSHMLSHLLLGMLAPLLIALSAPMTLLLRTIPITLARRFTYILKSKPVRIISDPSITSLLNIGGLWILYTTNLYSMMHGNTALHLFIHVHIFIVGYLFTISMIFIDPMPYRTSYMYRSIIFVIALAGHGILSKYIYANPPAHVPAAQAETGGMIMYYGGDAIDIILIFILCLHWFKSAGSRAFVKPTASK